MTGQRDELKTIRVLLAVVVICVGLFLLFGR